MPFYKVLILFLEHIRLFRRRGFIETGAKQTITDRQGREVLPQ